MDFHSTRYAEDPQELLTPVQHKSRFSGPCKDHPKNFGVELIVERDAKASLGYYTCEDCKRIKRIAREHGYFRKDGVTPLRKTK